jgi:methylated-DNA-[protein]-cysteine S-methyltransferase
VFELPLDPVGTEFQRRAWHALLEIPYGHTRTYAEQARRLGTGARAVGSANARNPLPIVVPCHRLVGTSGSLTGYAGGIDEKERLLRLEGALG